MGMVVRSNVMALNAFRQLGMNNTQVGKSLEKLSSGFRVNRAGDDASGLAISEKMKAQIKGLETASANAQDGISLIQTAEGALTEVHDMLNRMVELAGKAANGTMDDDIDRPALQAEVDELVKEINRIADSTNFNGTKLLNGSMAALDLQIGDAATDIMTVTIDNMNATSLGVAAIDFLDSSGSGPTDAITILRGDLSSGGNDKGAINLVSEQRAALGALQNRLEHTINNLDVAAENMTAANSRIRDTDMAKQMMEYTKMNVLTQAAQAMLAQANMQPQSILQLLQ